MLMMLEMKPRLTEERLSKGGVVGVVVKSNNSTNREGKGSRKTASFTLKSRQGECGDHTKLAGIGVLMLIPFLRTICLGEGAKRLLVLHFMLQNIHALFSAKASRIVMVLPWASSLLSRTTVRWQTRCVAFFSLAENMNFEAVGSTRCDTVLDGDL